MKYQFHPGVQAFRKLRLTWSFLAMLVAISCGCGESDTEQQDGSSKAEHESEATSGPDLSDPEKLAIAILDTLIQGDKEAYASFATPPKDEWKKIIQEQLQSLENDPNAAFLRDRLQSSLERFDKNFQRGRINGSEEWEAIFENGKNDGINWSEAMFIRSKFKIQERMIPELGKKMLTAEMVNVFFIANGTTYHLSFRVIAVDGSWYADHLNYGGRVDPTEIPQGAQQSNENIQQEAAPAAKTPDAATVKKQMTPAQLALGDPVVNSVGMLLVPIPAGEFQMGSRVSAAELAKRFEVPVEFFSSNPRHRVTLTKPFYLGATEVTKGQFRQFVLAESYRTDGKRGMGFNTATGTIEQNPKYNWKNCGFAQTDDHPVVNVSWNDAQAFCKWLSAKEGVTYRLPTEAEWEYACRAGTTTMYQTGDDPEGLVSVDNVLDASAKSKVPEILIPASLFLKASDGFAFTAPVGGFRANPWGLHDMHGNVHEWCQDRFGEYPRGDVTDPMGPPQGEFRVSRGGSFWSHGVLLRSAGRVFMPLGSRTFMNGFRAARTYHVSP